MSLFSKSAAIELKEFKTKFAQLEQDFNAYKEAHGAFAVEKEALATKVATYESDINGFKEREANLTSELTATSAELETLKAQAVSVSEAAALELAKVGQAPINQAPVVAADNKTWEDMMAISDPNERRAFYVKYLKGKQ